MAELFIESQSGQSDLLNTAYSSEVTWGSAIPKGMIAPFGRTVPPEGWLICDGSTLNALQDVMYRSLYDAIGTTWGGTGENDFQIPDLRGEFLRGVDSGRSADPDAASRTGGDVVGSSQTDAFQNHQHVIAQGSQSTSISGEGNTTQGSTASGGSDHTTTHNATLVSGAFTGAVTGTFSTNIRNTYGIPRISSETRPKNVAVLYCIKY